MITDEEIEEHKREENECFFCKKKMLSDDTRYALCKETLEDSFVTNKAVNFCDVSFCEPCWKEIAGEKYEMKGHLPEE